MRITEIAQKVQKSAYPEAYADHEQEGRLLASTLSGHSPEGLGCRLDDATTGDPAALKAALSKRARRRGHGQRSHPHRQAAASERAPGAPGSYAVAKARVHGATSVRVGSSEWTRTRDTSGWEWHDAKGGKATTVTVTFAG